MRLRKNYASILVLFIAALGFTSCSSDDDGGMDTNMDLTSSLVAEDQMLENGMIMVENVTMSEDGWIVIHRDNGMGGPMVPEIISVPEQVMEGTSNNVMIELEEGVEINDGETLWVMLHTDNGMMGVYEFDGENGLDGPITDAEGNIVMDPITVQVEMNPMGSFTATDQTIMNNTVMVNSVTMNVDGWVVIHAATAEGGPVLPGIISEPMYLEAGTTENVEVMLEESANVQSGDKLWIMLHTDTGTTGEYEFDGQNGLDGPILDENGDIVMSSIIVQVEPMGSFTATDQEVMNNMVMVNSVTMNVDGWVVIHAATAEGGPVLPGIISEPMYLEAGTTQNVEVMLEESANVQPGDTLWIMLHTDTGTTGTYEFDGQSGLDGPILDANGDIVMSPITVL